MFVTSFPRSHHAVAFPKFLYTLWAQHLPLPQPLYLHANSQLHSLAILSEFSR